MLPPAAETNAVPSGAEGLEKGGIGEVSTPSQGQGRGRAVRRRRQAAAHHRSADGEARRKIGGLGRLTLLRSMGRSGPIPSATFDTTPPTTLDSFCFQVAVGAFRAMPLSRI